MSVTSVISDISALRGSEVTIFGRSTRLNSEEDNRLYIDVIDILRNLEDYEVNTKLSNRIIKLLEEDSSEIEVITRDNTYNYGSNLSNDMDYAHIKYKDRDYVILSIHRYGDVRGNYTSDVVLAMDLEELYSEISEIYKLDSVEVGDKCYNLYINPLSEGIEVSDSDGNDIGVIYTNDISDVANEISELIR